jgi:LmbE family N-acetylglucosaminyl deacetylase
MRVLAIGAHPDDAELGAGATLYKHALAGDATFILTLTQGVTSRFGPASEFYRPANPRIPEVIAQLKSQAEKAAECLGAQLHMLDYPDQGLESIPALTLARAIEEHVHLVRPDVVYVHSPGDGNLDHRIVADAVEVATRPIPGSSVKRLLAYEVPGSTARDWRGFHPNVFVDVSGEPIGRKWAALEFYQLEMRAYPHPRSVEGLMALSAWRGVSAGVRDCEAFELVRSVE